MLLFKTGCLTSFGGLLEVTVHTHTGETEDSGLNHFGCGSQVLGEKEVVMMMEGSRRRSGGKKDDN